MSTPFNPREAHAGLALVASAILTDAGGIRTALRDAARDACVTSGLLNVPDERLDQIAALGVATAFGALPGLPR